MKRYPRVMFKPIPLEPHQMAKSIAPEETPDLKRHFSICRYEAVVDANGKPVSDVYGTGPLYIPVSYDHP